MYRVKRLYILAGVLALTCAAAVWALHQEERQEQIASSGETVLEIDPEGLSISNILADIYLSDLKELICNKFDVAFFRYVDDILILCQADQAGEDGRGSAAACAASIFTL